MMMPPQMPGKGPMPPPGGPGGPPGAPPGGPPPDGHPGDEPEGGNPVIEALKILQQFASAQAKQGNPQIAEWLKAGIQMMSGGGAEEGPGDLPGGPKPPPPAPGRSGPMPEHAGKNSIPVM